MQVNPAHSAGELSLNTITSHPIPLFSASGKRLRPINERELRDLMTSGCIVRIIRAGTGQAGRIVRVIRTLLAGEGDAAMLSGVSGTKYSFEQRLECGSRAWTLMGSGHLAMHSGVGFHEPIRAA